MRGYLVDPFERTVTEVETTGYPHFKDLIKVDMICAVSVKYAGDGEDSDSYPKRDTIWVDDEGLYVKDQKYFKVSSYDQPLAGRGICLGTDSEGETVGAYMEFDEFKSMISFLDIELDHMEQIPEGAMTTSPMFGDEPVPVMGMYPIFKPAPQSDE